MSRPVSHAMNRQLWRVLALLLAVQSLVLSLTTQTTENFLNACIVWGCALLVLDGDPLPRRLQPTLLREVEQRLASPPALHQLLQELLPQELHPRSLRHL